MEGAIVVTRTENVAAVFPFAVAAASEGMQVDFGGAPVQLSATVPLNPLIGVICRLYRVVGNSRHDPFFSGAPRRKAY